MNKLLLAILVLLLTSCATTVQFKVEHPPLVDLRDVDTITVIPVEWSDDGPYSYLAGDLTKYLSAGVKKHSRYRFVEPAKLKNVDESNYHNYVDVYILVGVSDVSTTEDSKTTEEQVMTEDESGKKTNAKAKRITTVTRTVTVNIDYQYIRAIDNTVLGRFNKNTSSSESFEESQSK